jgi:NhaP-type Na+/H+ or K+/H+ antiporter
MADKTPRQSFADRIADFAAKLGQLELGRYQAAILAILFACVWCVIGLLSGYLLSYLIVSWTSSGVDSRSPAALIFNASVLVCTGYGIVRGWRLYRAFSETLDG